MRVLSKLATPSILVLIALSPIIGCSQVYNPDTGKTERLYGLNEYFNQTPIWLESKDD